MLTCKNATPFFLQKYKCKTYFFLCHTIQAMELDRLEKKVELKLLSSFCYDQINNDEFALYFGKGCL